MKKQTKAATHGDRYYGATARDYDRKRTGKRLWQLEADAVAQLVRAGPVLDVPFDFEARREWWTAEQIKQHLHGLRQYSPGCITKDKPRRDPQDSSAVMIDCGGKLYHMDGRRRMNLWMQVPSLYSVLIVKAERCD